MVRGLISERSYPWVVKPAGLNGWIRHRLSARFLRGLELWHIPRDIPQRPVIVQPVWC